MVAAKVGSNLNLRSCSRHLASSKGHDIGKTSQDTQTLVSHADTREEMIRHLIRPRFHNFILLDRQN